MMKTTRGSKVTMGGRSRERTYLVPLPALFLLLVLAPISYSEPVHSKTLDSGAPKSGDTQAALHAYEQSVRAASAAELRTPGSIWSEDGGLTQLSADVRAMRIHDLISIVVAETLSASTDGSVKNSRSSNASSQVASLFGALSKSNSLQQLISQNSASGLNAQGQSIANSSLNTVVGGQVVDVLPNGTLVIEADREVAFNQQTQMIRLRGLVRPVDVSTANEVLSTSITDLELEVVGKGIINDYTYRQNPLVRLLERILIF
jgi:flagellar L-ring protein precursor FlgH